MKKELSKIVQYLEQGKINENETRSLLLDLLNVNNRLSEMEEAGKEATSLIAHLKDQHGFNDVEVESQDKIISVFGYEGYW